MLPVNIWGIQGFTKAAKNNNTKNPKPADSSVVNTRDMVVQHSILRVYRKNIFWRWVRLPTQSSNFIFFGAGWMLPICKSNYICKMREKLKKHNILYLWKQTNNHRMMKTKGSQSQGIRNQCQQPLSFSAVFGHVLQSSPPIFCALLRFLPK